MKIKFILFFNIILLFSQITFSQTIYLDENFEASSIPTGWSYGYVSGSIDWKYQDGGYTSGSPGTGEPPYAFQGEKNAMFYFASINNETTKLITPEFDLSYAIKPELVFWHAQVDKLSAGSYNHDELRIYYRISETDPWVLLEEYVDEVTDWTERRIQLPDSALSSTYYVAFEGKTQNGFGTCIDSMFIIETGVTPKYIESLNTSQPITRVVPTSSQNKRILRIDISVKGNDGTIQLDSIGFVSLNDDDSDIANNSVKLFASDDIYFYNAVQVSSGKNFIDGKVDFDNLNHELPTGLSALWLTYDIIDDVNHELQDHVLDAYVPVNGIKISNNYFPAVDQSPSGERLITESIFNDDFESTLTWTLTGEFEHDTLYGLGGSIGSPDPNNATSGSYIIGTDLSGLGDNKGDYEDSIGYHAYQAITPLIDAEYYKNTKLYFSRWLNIEVSDSALIEYSTDGGTSWDEIWFNNATITDKNWQFIELNTSSHLDKTKDFQLNFSLGGTNGSWELSGWNIDDVFVTGDYIAKDVGIIDWIAPLDGCGHTDEEYVWVTIENFAGETLTDPLPLSYSFDGGTTIYRDTIQSPNLAVKSTMDYKITKPIDLTNPGLYEYVYATTNLPGDEITSNDKITREIFISPTYTLPYSQNFENNDGYYITGGTNSTWQYGNPDGTIINSAASGEKAWGTNLAGEYYNNDSSFIESPCFDFTGSDSIIFEFKCMGLSEDKIDGLTVLYSIDQGVNWNVIPNDSNFYWTWFNEDLISELELPGIDTTNGEWLTYRHLLPPEASNQDNVKFRFAFESNNSASFEGFAIDDIKVYDAPYDVGVRSLIYPYTDCEWKDTTHVKVYVENYGITAVKAGTKIPLSLKFESETILDTLTLASDLAVEDSVLFMFESTVDMSYTGSYDFIINTKLESNTYFYNDTLSNDTLYSTVSVTGMPRYDIGWIVGSDDLDTLLDAGTFQGTPYDPYLWYFEGSEVAATQTYRAQAEGVYYVTVTNAAGCSAEDSLKVVPSLVDVKMDSIRNAPTTVCVRPELTEIKASISNVGQNLVDGVNDTIPFGYKVNDLPEVLDTLIFDGRDLTTTPPYDTLTYTFPLKCDLTEIGEYTISVFTNFADDLNRSDDTISTTISTYGMPDVELAFDTIYSSQADTLTLDAGAGFLTYFWDPGDSTTQTITPTNSSYYYKVTVTDINSCGSDKDSTYIEAHDLGISKINLPKDTCENEVIAPTSINIDLVNYSSNTYASTETVNLYYSYDGAGFVNVTPQLGTDLLANDTISLDIDNIDISTPGEHTLKVYTSSEIDANNTNDTIDYTFNTWEFPDVELEFDSIFTTRADTVVLYPTLGFDTYTWSNGSNNDTLIVTNKSSYNYVVTVTDAHGCGDDKDSTMIFTYDVKLNSIESPKDGCSNSSTETVSISLYNNSSDIMFSGEKIDVAYIFNGGAPIEETITLASDFYPTQTINYDFTNKVDMSMEGTYTLKVFSDFSLDVYRANDTLYTGIKTYGYPVIDIGPDIYTYQPDTVEIVANPGYTNYTWNEGTKNDTLFVSKPESFKYKVTVTNINGCGTTDSTTVYTTNVKASALIAPISTCEYNSTESVTVEVENNCSDVILSGETITVSYKLGSGSLVTENLVLTTDLLPTETVEHTFASTIDLTAESNYSFKIFARYSIDVNTNDTLTVDINEVGYPTISLGDDIYTTTPVGTVISGPTGYSTYTWQDGSSTTDFTVSYPASAQYSLTVTDSYGCEGSDALEVYTYNVAASSLIAPISQCELTSTETVTMSIINNSQDTLLNGETINVSYILNSGTLVNESFNLAVDSLKPTETVNYTFTQTADLSANQTHQFKLFAKLDNIDVESNDTVSASVDYQKPFFDLGGPETVGGNQYEINAGSGYTNYEWFDGTSSAVDSLYTVDINDQNPNHYYAVTVTNSFGCTAIDSIEVNFTTVPDLSVTNMFTPEEDCWVDTKTYPVYIEITNSGPINLNPGTSFTVGYKVDNGTPVTETFNLSTAMNASDTREHTFATQVSFASAKVYNIKTFVSFVDDETNSNDTLSSNVNISAPEVSLGLSDTITFEGSTVLSTSESYNSYVWSTGETTPTITITETNTYSVTVTDNIGCNGEGKIHCINTATGIDNIIKGNNYEISYYPNPTSDKLMIQFDNKKAQDAIIEMINSNGRIVYTRKLDDIKNTIERIDVNPFANGVYYLRIQIDQELFTRKIIIQ